MTFNKEVGFLLLAIRRVEEARGDPFALSKDREKMETACHQLIVSALFRPNDICEAYWDFVRYDKLQDMGHEDHVEQGVKIVMAWEGSSEAVQTWLKEKRIVQARYYEEDACVYLDEAKDKTE